MRPGRRAEVSNVPAALDKVIAFLREQIGGSLPAAIGHRVVHGGPDYSEPAIVSDAVLDRLERFVRSPRCISPTTSPQSARSLERQPHLLQVACFDTAFHRGHPDVADRFAIPEDALCRGRAPLRISWPVL